MNSVNKHVRRYLIECVECRRFTRLTSHHNMTKLKLFIRRKLNMLLAIHQPLPFHPYAWPINFIQISSKAIYLNKFIECGWHRNAVTLMSMWNVNACTLIWLKWNCFALWPFVHFQQKTEQKRASRTSAHIYCHLVYHIDLVFVSFFAFSLLSFSLLLKISTIFPSPMASASFVFYHFRHSVSVHRLFEYVVSVALPKPGIHVLFFFSALSSPSSRLLVFELLVVPWFMARFTNHKNINKKTTHCVALCWRTCVCVCMCLFRNSVRIRNGNQ